MAIQVRRGLKKDFDPYKMLPGEWAVSIDAQTQNQIVWMCFAAGVVKRMGTYEDFMAQIREATGDIRDEYIAEFEEIEKEIRKLADTTQSNTDTVVQVKSDIVNTYLPQIQQYVESAENSANLANDKSKKAEDYSKLSESWAHGNTGVRSGENTNNSEYFSSLADTLVQEAQKLLEQAKKIVAAATQGALIPAGTITFAELPLSPEVGYMYNISNDFTTDNRFVEGAGVFYRAGANVYWTKDGKWDVMIGAQVTGVKGDAESTYHIGNVNITKSNIGLGNVENKSSAAIRGEITNTEVVKALGYTPLDFADVANNLTTTESGYALDARQGRVLKESIDKLNSDLFYESSVIQAKSAETTTLKTIEFTNGIFLLTVTAGTNTNDANARMVLDLGDNRTVRGTMISGGGLSLTELVDARNEAQTIKITFNQNHGETINCRYHIEYIKLR